MIQNYQVDLPELIKKYKSKLDYRINFEKHMNTITKILTQYDNNNIDYVLKHLGNATNSNRVYIFEFKDNLNIVDNTYEWCSENTSPQIKNLTDLPSDMFPWWMKKLKNNEPIIINNIDNIPSVGKNEKEILKEQSIKSLAVIPLFNNKLHGFMGFDDTEKIRIWKSEDIDLLIAAGNLITTYWDREQINKQLIKKNRQLSKIVDSIIKTLTNITENKDIYTKNHSYNVAVISVRIALKLGLNKEQINIIRQAALLHDIGKIEVHPGILFKPNHLSDLEYEIIKKHAEFGYEIVKDIEFNDKIKKIILQHHERNNGSGYPQGLKTDEILLETKIIAVADVFEAMISQRSYRPALSISEALNFLKENRKVLFDSKIVDILVELVENNKLEFLNKKSSYSS